MLLPRLLATLTRTPPVDPRTTPEAGAVEALGGRLAAASRRRLGRSLAVFEVSIGGCGGCALEMEALRGAAHGIERYGIGFAASPRGADVLLASGAVLRNGREALERALACMPEPRWVVAAGDCAVDGGVFKGGYAVEGGVAAALPVDLVIPGCPPTPAALLEGLVSLIEAEAQPVRGGNTLR